MAELSEPAPPVNPGVDGPPVNRPAVIRDAVSVLNDAAEKLLRATQAIYIAERQAGYRDGYDDGYATGFRDGRAYTGEPEGQP
jgi:hypothetical protein